MQTFHPTKDFKKLKYFLWMLVLAEVFTNYSCKHEEKAVSENYSTITADTALGFVIADTITYEVVIRNPNPDDTWKEQSLKNLNHQFLIDNIFNLIRAGKAIAYDYETNERLTVNQLKKIENEKDFNPHEIGMIQFTEIWFLNPDKSSMTKQVYSMVLGYNYYTSQGEHFGYKPLFKVKLQGN